MSAFEVLEDPRVAAVLRRLHREADRQTPALLLHDLPKLPRLLLGRKLRSRHRDLSGRHADRNLALERQPWLRVVAWPPTEAHA